MQEFIILIAVLFNANGKPVGFNATPTPGYLECNYAADALEANIAANPEMKDYTIRTACVSSEYVRRNGV